MENELIKITTDEKGQQLVSAKELYLGLGLDKSHWSRWYTQNIIKNTYFNENIDWFSKDIIIYGNKTMDFLISLSMAIHLINSAKTITSNSKIKLLNVIENSTKYVIDVTSKAEIKFKEDLFVFLKPFDVPIETQVSVCENKYRLDFVVNGNIVVEYDEEHHDYRSTEDNIRTREVNEWYNKKTNGFSELIWVRVKKGNEINGFGEIAFKIAEQQAFIDSFSKYEIAKFKFLDN